MVSNNSTFDQDLASAGNELHKLGQLAGIGPQDVIPGDPATTAEIGEHLSKLGSALERAGQGIKSIDSDGWTGQAGDAFRANYLERAPGDWLKAADSFTDAGQAVMDYQQVLATEKPRAQRAKEELDRSIAVSEAAARKHNAAVEAYNAGGSGAQPGAFVDPGAEARARAQQEIEAAKAAVQAAGDRAADIIFKACAGAPEKPGLLADLIDGLQALGDTAYEFGSGVVEGSVGMVTGVVGLGVGLGKAYYYSMPGMNFIDPEGYAKFNEAASTTLQSVIENPYQAVKTVVDVDGWKQNPAKALGSMAPDAVASIAGGAGVVTKFAKGTDALSGVADAARATDRVSDVGRHAPDNTPPWADLDSVPPPRSPEPPAPNPWDGHEFGPKGSDPLPDPEPPPSPAPEPRNNELPDWFDDGYDNTPDSWLDDGNGAPEPPPDPVPSTHRDPDPLPGSTPEGLSPQQIKEIDADIAQWSRINDYAVHPEQKALAQRMLSELYQKRGY